MSKEQITSTFDLVASTFDQIGPPFFAYSGHRLVELAQVPTGSIVLDVATGRGAILFPAAEQTEPHGRVIGIDRSKKMLRELASDIRQANWQQIDICLMDATQLGFASKSCDFVFCGHAIFYFPQALQEFHRILKPGGQVALNIVSKGCLDWVFDILSHHLTESELAEDDSQKDQNATINTIEGLKELLSAANYDHLQIIEEAKELVYKDEDEWWAAFRTLGVRATLEKMEPQAVAAMKTEMNEYVQKFKQPDGIYILYRVLYALGRKIS